MGHVLRNAIGHCSRNQPRRHSAATHRTGISITVTPTDRRRLEAHHRKPQRRPEARLTIGIVLLSAEGVGTVEIMPLTAKSKTSLWRWQARFIG